MQQDVTGRESCEDDWLAALREEYECWGERVKERLNGRRVQMRWRIVAVGAKVSNVSTNKGMTDKPGNKASKFQLGQDGCFSVSLPSRRGLGDG